MTADSFLDYSGKTCVVAGGSSGINLGIAQAFAAAGAQVGLISRDADRLAQAQATLAGESRFAVADVRDFAAVEAAMAGFAVDWGQIDVLVSGAAGNFFSAAAELSANGFKTVVDIDLLGTFNVLRAGYPYLRKPGAAVINITAPQSVLPTVNQVHVCAAKAGIDQVTRTCALEWGPSGVRVNAISPGPIRDTEGMRRLAPSPAAEQAWAEAVPLKRYGDKSEIANAALWLCSPLAAYITGAILPVDGGFTLGGSSSMTQAAGAQ